MSLITVSIASADVLTVCSIRAVRRVDRYPAPVRHADDSVHRSANLVAHVCQKFALGAAGCLGVLFRFAQLNLRSLQICDVVTYPVHKQRMPVGMANQLRLALKPDKPSVARHHSIDRPQGLARKKQLRGLLAPARTVVRMNPLVPPQRIAQAIPLCIAKQSLHVVANVSLTNAGRREALGKPRLGSAPRAFCSGGRCQGRCLRAFCLPPGRRRPPPTAQESSRLRRYLVLGSRRDTGSSHWCQFLTARFIERIHASRFSPYPDQKVKRNRCLFRYRDAATMVLC